MNNTSASVWIVMIVAVGVVLGGIVAWAMAVRRRHHHVSGLSATLVDQHLGLADVGLSPAKVAYLNLQLTNHGDKPVVVDGLGYRRSGSHRLIPIRNLDAPGPGSFEMAADDTLLPPPYRLAPGASQTITIHAPALCAPDDLVGIYMHLNNGELVWLPPGQLEALTHSCTWASEATSE